MAAWKRTHQDRPLRLVRWNASIGSGGPATGSVVVSRDGGEISGDGQGNGAVNALFQAIDAAVAIPCELEEYHVEAEPTLEGFAGRVSDSGEGRWTAIAAIEEGVPADVLTAALSSRFSSRGEADYANTVLSAMRQQFGGHAEKPA